MSELTIHAKHFTINHQSFRDCEPLFDTLNIVAKDRHGTETLVKIFFSDTEHSERLARAVAAFNEAMGETHE